MRLKDLLKYDNIIVQCHDNPDADAIGSGYAIKCYLDSYGKNTRFVYSGINEIHKTNLLLMIQMLSIPIEYVKSIDRPDLLVMVDCQYGEGNVSTFDAETIAVIDHHQFTGRNYEMMEILNNYASCCSIIYNMLQDENYNINADKNLATALYYGLYMDTNGFSESKHPSERDMIDDLSIRQDVIIQLKNSNFSLEELKIAGEALSNRYYSISKKFAIIKTEPCDPNLLGFVSDLVLQVDEIDSCLVYSESDSGYKLSVRSCMREATALDIIKYLVQDIGSGGGHKMKSGGMISKDSFFKHYSYDIQQYFKDRLNSYFESYEIIDADRQALDTTDMLSYRKLPVVVGIVKTLDFAEPGEPLNIRTLEGDVSVQASQDCYIIIGIMGDAYPINKKTFDSKYTETSELFICGADYKPKARNLRSQKLYNLLDYAQSCVSGDENIIYAKQLDKTTKVFSRWDYDSYMLGNKDDYLAVKADDSNDIYIIKQDIFSKTYEHI